MGQGDRWRPLRCPVQPWREALWIQPDGELDLESIGVVEDTLEKFLDAGFSQIVVDLRKVTFVDSSALRMLIQAGRDAAGRDVGFSVAPGPPPVQRLFEVTGTASLFQAPPSGDGPGPA